MKYTIILKKVIREVVGLITIVLFIYTCTKVRSAAGRRKAVSNDTISTNAAVGFNWPLQRAGFDVLWPRNIIWCGAEDKKVNAKGAALYRIAGAIRPIWAPSIRFPG